MQYKAMFQLIMIMSVLVMVLSCSDVKTIKQEHTQYKTIDEVPEEVWSKVSKLRILFGHQSVGENILEGVADVMKAHPAINLNIVETRETSKNPGGVFAHFKVGENKKPISKMEDMIAVVKSKENNNLDIAFLKLCYVDIDSKANVQEIFDKYKETVANLEKPVKLLHFTVPLTITKKNWKTRLKVILGKKDIWEYSNNIARNEYNRLLLEEYQAKGSLFDIAKIESTYWDGNREEFKYGKKAYSSLIEKYTYDNGHLNEVGRQLVAKELLLTIANSLDRVQN